MEVTLAISGAMVLLSLSLLVYFVSISHGSSTEHCESEAVVNHLLVAQSRIISFAVAMPIWIMIYLLIVHYYMNDVNSVVICATGLIVLFYMIFELNCVKGYTGSLFESEGTDADLPSERSIKLATVAFALGTLLVSYKDPELVSEVTPVIFLGLLVIILPSLASGAAARRRSKQDPWFGAVQRVVVTFGAGVLSLALALCVSKTLNAHYRTIKRSY